MTIDDLLCEAPAWQRPLVEALRALVSETFLLSRSDTLGGLAGGDLRSC